MSINADFEGDDFAPDPSQLEQERPFELTFTGTYFSRPAQLTQMAIHARRHLVHMMQLKIDESFLNGVKLTDDYMDDRGESWHALDWTKEGSEDEGLHPDVT